MTRSAMLVAAFALFAAGCASRPGETEVRYGRVVRIDPVSLQSDHQLGIGSVLGTVAANALGHPGAMGTPAPLRRCSARSAAATGARG